MLKIAVIGAGGVGGYYGGLLAAAGNTVHFLARGPHLHAMRLNGLQILSVLGDFRVQPVLATDQPEDIGTVDLALFCTKAFSTDSAARQCLSLVDRETAVLSLQNGVEGPERLVSVFGQERVLAGATWISSAIESPGIIRQASDIRRIVLGELDGDMTSRTRSLQRHFDEAGIVCEVSSNIQSVLWEKLLFISAVAGIGSLTRLPMADYRGVAAVRELLLSMMRETAGVAAALGVSVEAGALERAMQYIDDARPGVKASMQLDLEANRPSELEALIGVVVRKGRECGVPTPVASTIYSLLLPLEGRSR